MNLLLFQKCKLFFVVLFFTANLFALNTPVFTPQEQKWIEDNPTITLGADYNWPPYEFLNKTHKHTGIAADYLALISQKSGLKFRIKSDVWTKVIEQMQAGELDGLGCAVKTPQREEFLHFTRPYVSMPLVIVMENKRKDVSTIEDLNNMNVAVNKGSYLHEWLVKTYPNINLVLTSSNVESLELVSYNKVDAYIGNLAVATYTMEEKFLSNLKIITKLDTLSTDVSIGISKNKPTLFSIVQKTLDTISMQEHNKIVKIWFDKSRLNTQKNNHIELSTKEKEWMKKHPIVKVGGGPDWAPIDFVNKHGEYTGVSKNYLDLVAKKTGLEFEIVVDKWKNNLQKIENKEIDLLHAAYYTDDRTKIMDYTKSYFEMLDYFFIRDDVNATTMEDLNGKKIAMPRGYAHGNILLQKFPKIVIFEVDTFSEAIDAVLQNRADGLFDTLASLDYALQKDNVTNIIPFKSYRGKHSVGLHMATAKGNEELVSIINKGLQTITKEEKLKIHKEWFGTLAVEKKKIDFTQEEIEWMKDHPEIKYSEINWEPMSIIKDNTMIGIMGEYLDVISDNTGLKFKYIEASSWTQVIEKFTTKQIDMVPGIGASDYESKLGLTSDVYADFPFVLVTKNTQSFIDDISELEGKTIAVPKYWTSYNYLKEQQPNINILEVSNIFEALDAVENASADAFMGHMAIGMHYVGTYYSKKLHIAGKVEYNFNHKILIQEENHLLLSIINKVFDSMSVSDHAQIKNRWLHVEVNKARDYTIFYQLGVLFFLIMAGTVFWNRKLSLEIDERKRIERDLKTEKDNFKILFEKVSDGNLIMQDGHFVMCNNAAIKMLGVNEINEVLHSTPSRWSPPLQKDGSSSKEQEALMVHRCMQEGSCRFDWIHLDANGKEFWVDIGLTKISYEGNDAIYVVWRDISAQKLLEQSLKEREQQMRTLIDNIPLHIIVSSYAGLPYLANKQTLYDYETDEKNLPLLNVSQFYIDLDEREEMLQELQTKGFVDKKIVQLERPSGIYSMMMSILPIKYEGEDMLLSIGVDLTQRLEMEKSLFEAKDVAEQANKSKSEFLANMSHEIRTPMNAIMGFTELLNEQVTQPRLKSYVKTIQTASGTLLTLINDILDLSKIEAGKLQLNNVPTDVNKLCNEIASIFTMNIKNKGLDLFLDIDKNIPKSLLIDEVRLRQILLNLIGNSVKFTESGYIKLSVKTFNVEEHLSKLDLEIKVEDTGLGIPESQLEKIFNEFEQNEGQDSRKFGGTGLGLSISQRLSAMMNGQISVESKEGMGSAFTVKLFKIDISSVVNEQNLNKKILEDMSNTDFNKATILVVDDIEDNRELIIHNFEETNIKIISAENGLEAIEVFKKEKPDLILMDIRMPVLDGYSSALQIKKISDVPIIALTASVMQDSYEQSKRENFDGFLRKPVLKHDLYSEISKYLTYAKPKANDENTEENTLISEKTRLNLPTILQILSVDIKQLQIKALQTNNISDMKNLASEIRSLALEFDSALLDTYSSKLYESIDAFDIPVMEQLLKAYNELGEKLSKY